MACSLLPILLIDVRKLASKVIFCIFFCLGAILFGERASSNQLEEVTVLLTTDGSLPYEESQPGDVISTFAHNVFGSWITSDANNIYHPSLAEFTFSTDYFALYLTVKPNVMFHDGSPVTAKDIKFSILRGLKTKYVNFYEGFLGCLQDIDLITSSTARLNFKRPCPEFLHALTLPYLAPRLKSQMDRDFVSFNAMPIGAGPYRLLSEDRERGEYRLGLVGSDASAPAKVVLLTKKPQYLPDISLNRGVAGFEGQLEHKSATAPDGTLVLFSAAKNRLFDNPQIRKLFYRVFDREVLSSESASPAYSLSLYGSVAEITKTEREEARSKLRDLVAELPSKDIKIALFGSIDDRRRKFLAELNNQFQALGLNVDFEVVQKKFLSKEDGETYAFWLATLIIDPLATATMLSSFRENSAFPFHSVQSDELTNLFSDWENASVEIRDLSSAKLDDYITSKGFGIPLLRAHNPIFFNARRLRPGRQDNGLFIDLKQIRAKKCSTSLSP